MALSIAKYRSRAASITKEADREIALRACDAYETIFSNEAAPSELADPLMQALRSRSRGVLDIVGVLIADLAETRAIVRDRLLLLMKSSKSTPKIAIVTAVFYWIRDPVPNPLRETMIEMCCLGLKNPSWRVRQFSAERAVSTKLKEVLPALKQAFEAEMDPKKKNSLEHNFVVLRDGYILEQESDRYYDLSIYNCYNRVLKVNTVVTGFTVPAEVINRLGISEVVRRLSAGEELKDL